MRFINKAILGLWWLLTLGDGPLHYCEVSREALLSDSTVRVDCQGQYSGVGDNSTRSVLPTVAADVRANCTERKEIRVGGFS